jgi:hypothetical protein
MLSIPTPANLQNMIGSDAEVKAIYGSNPERMNSAISVKATAPKCPLAMDTMFFIPVTTTIPKNCKATFQRIVATFQPEKENP